MKRPKSPRRILEEIQENKHLEWSDAECSEAINVLEKGKSVCLDILTNILPNQCCGRQYFEELSTLLEVNRQICLNTPKPPSIFERSFKDFESVVKVFIAGYFGFWILLILIAVFYG
ncbi:hypothetical protein VB264_05375 [Arcicella aquatica]|uniref:Uncharacterized protein n=1 Tax=Arcicella aquatica TaxID=217141 RepID=A0ABU5QJJ2_9BACT|nr:hypothetical protein [Arcicella aquatica]MEA5257208.1 hypothetical protein [Arcicella aquatica]